MLTARPKIPESERFFSKITEGRFGQLVLLVLRHRLMYWSPNEIHWKPPISLEMNKNVILKRSLYNCLMRPVSFLDGAVKS